MKLLLVVFRDKYTISRFILLRIMVQYFACVYNFYKMLIKGFINVKSQSSRAVGSFKNDEGTSY